MLTSVLFLFGLGYALWRTRDYRYLLLNGYFWAITVAIGIFSVPPGADSYRLLAALPAAILLAAIGLEQALTVLGLTDSARQTARVGALALMLGAISLINLQNYYVDFAQQCRYGGPGTRFASYLGAYLGTLNHETTVYLLSTEELHYGTHLSVDFLSGELPVANVPGSIADLRPGPDTVVIATPARVGELRAWMLDHPRGTLHSEYDCGQLILLAYQLP